MASDKSDNSSNSHPLNVRIKTEPGTSMPVPLMNIKTEPGLSSTTRLTSFRVPRDLTLGGNIKTEKPKKVYTPNLNVRRTKPKEDAPQNDSVKSTKSKDSIRARRDNSTGRDRGRGRGSSNLIQSSGVWSTGVAPSALKRSSSSHSTRSSESRSSQEFLEKPKLNLDLKINKAEEEEKLKLLLRDDFIDDDEEPVDFENSPIILPMMAEANVYKKEVKLKIKKEEEEEVDRKPIILENGEAIPPSKAPKMEASKSDSEPKQELDSIPKMIENKTNSYILIQLPDCLPGTVGNAENTTEKPRRPNSTTNEKEGKSKPPTESCTLNSLNSGFMGKLQILRSGKARLLLGENNLVVEVGVHCNFRQDLIAAKLDTENMTGDLINLGPVSSELICTPDWESLLANCKL